MNSTDFEIIAEYPLGQAIEDGVLYKVADLSNGRFLIASVGIYSDFKYQEIINIYKEFWDWKIKVEPTLPEEEKMFVVLKGLKKVWVMEDGNGFTVMYPEEY